jgi:hypothetical protein
MEQGLKYSDWQEPFRQAISERRGFVEIETVIRERLRSLIGGESEEREALRDALATVQVLKEDYAYAGWQHCPQV